MYNDDSEDATLENINDYFSIIPSHLTCTICANYTRVGVS